MTNTAPTKTDHHYYDLMEAAYALSRLDNGLRSCAPMSVAVHEEESPRKVEAKPGENDNPALAGTVSLNDTITGVTDNIGTAKVTKDYCSKRTVSLVCSSSKVVLGGGGTYVKNTTAGLRSKSVQADEEKKSSGSSEDEDDNDNESKRTFPESKRTFPEKVSKSHHYHTTYSVLHFD